MADEEVKFELHVPAAARTMLRRGKIFFGLAVFNILVSGLMGYSVYTAAFEARNHAVKQVTFTIDYNSSNIALIDDQFDPLVKSGFFPSASDAYRKLVVDPFRLNQGQWFYPDRPRWVGTAWDYGRSRKYWINNDVDRKLNFKGLPNTNLAGQAVLPNGYPTDFFRLPCDKILDEMLLGMSVLLLFNSLFLAILGGGQLRRYRVWQRTESIADVADLSRTEINAGRIMKLVYICVLTLVSLTAYMIFTSKTCEWYVPTLFYTSLFFLVVFFVGLVFTLVFWIRDVVILDSDPGPCGACGDSKSAVARVFPCGHYLDQRLDQPRCMTCADSMERCPVCDVKLTGREMVHRGKVAACGLAFTALFQLLVPFVLADWSLSHAACFVRDISPKVTTKGCRITLGLSFVMMCVGAAASHIAGNDKINKTTLKIYRWLCTAMLVLCTLGGVIYTSAASERMFTVTSKDKMASLRRSATPYQVMVDTTAPHFLANFSGSCKPNDPWYSREWFSCKLCDETAVESCFNSASNKYILDHKATARTAISFNTLVIAYMLGLIFSGGMNRAYIRFRRERYTSAADDFMFLLANTSEITVSTKFTEAAEKAEAKRREFERKARASRKTADGDNEEESEEEEDTDAAAASNAADSGEIKLHWRMRMKQDYRFHPQDLTNEDRQNIFDDYIKVLQQEQLEMLQIQRLLEQRQQQSSASANTGGARRRK